MKNLLFRFACIFALPVLAAAPLVSELDFVQDVDTGVATLKFTLEEEAVVTLDVQTNGVSICWRNFRPGITGCELGAVNPAGDYELKWDVYGSWGAELHPIRLGGIKAVVTAWSPDSPPDYMDVDLTADKSIRYYVDENDLPYPVTSSVYKTTHLLMKRIHAANKRWKMGSPPTEKWRAASDKLWEEQRDVVLSSDYYIGVFETTQKQWELFTGNSVSNLKNSGGNAKIKLQGDEYPMVMRSPLSLRGFATDSRRLWPQAGHNFAYELCDIKKLCDKAGRYFDLPTEAQWEYACRGGTITAYNTGTDGDSEGLIPDEELAEIAVYHANSAMELNGETVNIYREVGTKLPNAFGLYDTIGNVAEYCLDSRLNEQGGTFDPRLNDLVDPVGGFMTNVASEIRLAFRGSYYESKNSKLYSDNHDNTYGDVVNPHRSAYRGKSHCYFSYEIDYGGFRLVSPVGRAWPEMNDNLTDVASRKTGLRTIKFKYDLEEDAIVTLKVKVDGDPVAGLSGAAAGDINRLVKAGSGKIVSFNPDETAEMMDVDASRVSVELEKWSIDDPPAYMAFELVDPSVTNIEYYADGGVPGGATNIRYKTDWLLMRRIPAKDVVWWMGIATNAAGKSVEGGVDDPTRAWRHLVKLSEDYFTSVFPLTERQYHWINGSSPTNVNTYTLPMNVEYQRIRPHEGSTCVWPDNGHAVSDNCVLGRLRVRSGGYQFDMPTEAQWEYACRALTGSAYCDGNVLQSSDNGHNDANIEPYGWYKDNSSGYLHRVGEKLPNGFGLYDMHGNIWEWVLDFYDAKYGLTDAQLVAAQTTPIANPAGKTGLDWSFNRALRGGSFAHDKSKARSGDRGVGAYCNYLYWDKGATIRLVCPVTPVTK